MAKECVSVFLATAFGGARDAEGRHTRRVGKLSNPQLSKEPA